MVMFDGHSAQQLTTAVMFFNVCNNQDISQV